MTDKQDPTKPLADKEKFKPGNIADGSPNASRREREMLDVARGSEGDRRRSSQNRVG